MQFNDIEEIKQPPKIKSFKCKVVLIVLELFLRFMTLSSGLIALFLYDYFISIATLLVVFIIMGIIRSKLRNIAIPFSQIERDYSDKEIAQWYGGTMICFELDTKENNL